MLNDMTMTRIFVEFRKLKDSEMTRFELTNKFEKEHKIIAKIATTNEIFSLANAAGIILKK